MRLCDSSTRRRAVITNHGRLARDAGYNDDVGRYITGTMVQLNLVRRNSLSGKGRINVDRNCEFRPLAAPIASARNSNA